jgi:hypothetical protein
MLKIFFDPLMSSAYNANLTADMPPMPSKQQPSNGTTLVSASTSLPPLTRLKPTS